jgi:hypothetical protein
MVTFTEDQLNRCKSRIAVFRGAAKDYKWPDEVETDMKEELGPEWMMWVLAAIDSRESHFGALLDRQGLGDHGHGHGEMQVDDRSHGPFCATGKWRDLGASLDYIHHNVIVPAFNYLMDHWDDLQTDPGLTDYQEAFWDAIAAYNEGAGNALRAEQQTGEADARTTGGDYSKDVRARALALRGALEGSV